MSTVKDPGISGMLGAEVKIRKVRGQVIAKSSPKRVTPTAGEKLGKTRFAQAIMYAKQQVADAESNALYKTGITNGKRSVHAVAMIDFLQAPKVISFDATGYRGKIGETIKVEAVDDFMVTRVKVLILDGSGAIIEEGDAEQDPKIHTLWLYKATVHNPSVPGTTIKAIAFDRPNHMGTGEVKL